MAAGYSSRCLICSSPHRTEVELWCKSEGLSSRAASARLLQVHNEKVSHHSVNKHMQEHFDIRAEAREQYQKSKAQVEQLAAAIVTEVEMLDRIARENFELHLATRLWLQQLVAAKTSVPASIVSLHQATAAEVRQQLRQKLELLGEDPASKAADAMVIRLDDTLALWSK